MQFLLISLVPIAVSFLYIHRLLNFIHDFLSFESKDGNNDSLIISDYPDLWGTYRSNLYFGMRTKTPQALMTGLAWNSIDNVDGFSKMRHSCELDNDINFGWKEHNGRSFGLETITDKFHQIRLSINYFKVQSPSFPSREAWTVKISAKPLKKNGLKKLSLLFYLGYDGDSPMKLKEFETKTFQGYIGWTPEIGNFVFGMIKSNTSTTQKPFIVHDQVAKSKIWMVTDKFSTLMRQKLQKGYYRLGNELFKSDLSEYAQLSQTDYSEKSTLYNSNMLGYQFIFKNDEEVELFYFPYDGKTLSEEHVQIHLNALAKEEKVKKQEEFRKKVLKKFNLKEDSELIPFVKYALSNLLGGISYFYGDSEVFSTEGSVLRTTEEALFTDVPARANFPRGFYWDSGFHNILIGKWDMKLSLEILSNWIEKINEDGWVGREQILGDEARSKVPIEYITQNPKYSNPPAPLLPIEMITNIVKTLEKDASFDFDLNEIKTKLKKMYPKLVSHFNWFLKTQRATLLGSPEEEFLFRWRGRSDHHTLTSGLDDYPRGNVPSEYELHVDLLSWMAFACRSLSNIKRQLGIEEDTVKNEPDFDNLYQIALRNLHQYHWDESRGCFSDVTINDDEDGLMFVPNVGYVSLFPMLFGLLKEDDPKLEKLFEIIEDPNQLWTNYGIRSLSKSDPFYYKGDEYWTGPIWINLNYLILSSIKKYYFNNEKGRGIYERLRNNLIENMSSEWKRTGFIWEQYNDITGKGQRSRPFSGWSSLIVLIIAEDYH